MVPPIRKGREMKILFYIVIGLFGLFGFGILESARRSKHIGLFLGASCYLGAGILALALSSWWPLLGGFLLSFVVRGIFGDPFRG